MKTRVLLSAFNSIEPHLSFRIAARHILFSPPVHIPFFGGFAGSRFCLLCTGSNPYCMIKLEDVKRIYRTEEVETLALHIRSLEIGAGEFIAIMGPSGCGKSTLLNILGLLDDATRGSYLFEGVEMYGHSEKKRAEIRKQNIGFVFQNFNLIDELTVYENIELPLLYLDISEKEIKRKVETVMDKMRITHRRDHFPRQLSGGQQQRAAICRAIVTDPKIILADEPTGNLDSRNGNEVMNLLTELNKTGTNIIMVTHSQHDANFANRIIHLLDGGIVTETRRR
jgi:putative ABC transport system ATP-binding protein